MNAPIPNFEAIVRATPTEQLPVLVGALAEAEARALARIAAEAGRGRRGSSASEQPVQWIRSLEAARLAGLDVSTKRKAKTSQSRIAQWAKGKSWASHPSKRVLLVDKAGFDAWLKVKAAS